MKTLIMKIWPLNEDAFSIGLTLEAITTTVRKRLHTANIRDTEIRRVDSTDEDVLCVTLTVKSADFNLDIRHCKWDPKWNEPSSTSIWEDHSKGRHDGSPVRVLKHVEACMNKFTDAYGQINTDACS